MIILKKKMEVKTVPFSKLLKLELPSLAKLVQEIVEKHKPEVLHIQEVFDLLIEEDSNIKALNAIYGVHPMTLQLKPLREKLMLYVSALRVQLKVASKIHTQQQHVIVTQLAFDTHVGGLRMNKNEKVIHEKIGEFLDEISRNEDLQDALETLGLNILINSLKLTLSEVREILAQRLALKSLRPKEKTKELSKSIESALKDLFKQIEVAQLKHTDVNYKPLFDELNDTLNVFRNLVNIREAKNKRKAEERKALENGGTEVDNSAGSNEPGEEPGDMGTPSVFMASAAGDLAPEAEKDNNNGESIEEPNQSLNQRKAAASPSKDLQLPKVGNDDDDNA